MDFMDRCFEDTIWDAYACVYNECLEWAEASGVETKRLVYYLDKMEQIQQYYVQILLNQPEI